MYFFFLCELETPQTNFFGIDRSWCDQNYEITSIRTTVGKWWYSMYIAFLMMVGESIEPTTTPERIYMVASIIVGHVVTAVIIGNVSVIISNQDSISVKFARKLEAFQATAELLHLPPDTVARIEEYYDLVWSSHRALSSKDSFIQDLNPCKFKQFAQNIL